MPTAVTMTHKVKSSREPVRAICQSSHGKSRRPTTSMSAIKTETWPRVNTIVVSKPLSPASSEGGFVWPPSHTESAGSSTSTRTITRSSTTSQPIAIRPLTDSRTPRLSSALSRTTVLATESARPNTMPAARPQPQRAVTAMPSKVATTIWTRAPGRAIWRTANKSSKEKCSPTPNINNITPISASWLESSWSATKPGVAGPMMMPAIR